MKSKESAYNNSTISFDQVKTLLSRIYDENVEVEVFLVRAKTRLTLSLKDYYLTVENHTKVMEDNGLAAPHRYLMTESPLLQLTQISSDEVIATLFNQPRRQTLWDAVDGYNEERKERSRH